MTEPQPTQPATEIPKPSYRDLYDMAVTFLVFPAFAFMAVRRTAIWPYAIPGFLALGLPLLLIGVRAWRRWFHPDRLPARWPSGYRLMTNLQTLDSALSWTWVLGIAITWALDLSSHHSAYIAFAFIAGAAAAWEGLLRKYIADRKYIPPPRPPYDPSKSWTSTMKPFHSEHWGRNA
jgi:hypothetical protein